MPGMSSTCIEISLRVFHPRDAIPPLQDANERDLRHILGFVPIPHYQAQRPIQPGVLAAEELLEGPGLRRLEPLRDGTEYSGALMAPLNARQGASAYNSPRDEVNTPSDRAVLAPLSSRDQAPYGFPTR
jgi:hypothetical protein